MGFRRQGVCLENLGSSYPVICWLMAVLRVSLKQSSIEGVTELAALSTQGFASTSIRLANNIEIGVEVCNTLVQESNQSIEIRQS